MRITRVELENIKSYQKLHIDFAPGTTAIRGQNGAGKSTLVEAIGFALFDALAYKQAQFVREGERIGVVTVTFTSALDDREYQAVRRCGGSSDWFIFDPEVQDRVVEQRIDVIAFLRQHLRIESDLNLSTIFNDAIGVPQGTFTADFLLTPATRKKKFDVLLQVEDYRTAADKLLERESLSGGAAAPSGSPHRRARTRDGATGGLARAVRGRTRPGAHTNRQAGRAAARDRETGG